MEILNKETLEKIGVCEQTVDWFDLYIETCTVSDMEDAAGDFYGMRREILDSVVEFTKKGSFSHKHDLPSRPLGHMSLFGGSMLSSRGSVLRRMTSGKQIETWSQGGTVKTIMGPHGERGIKETYKDGKIIQRKTLPGCVACSVTDFEYLDNGDLHSETTRKTFPHSRHNQNVTIVTKKVYTEDGYVITNDDAETITMTRTVTGSVVTELTVMRDKFGEITSTLRRELTDGVETLCREKNVERVYDIVDGRQRLRKVSDRSSVTEFIYSPEHSRIPWKEFRIRINGVTEFLFIRNGFSHNNRIREKKAREREIATVNKLK